MSCAKEGRMSDDVITTVESACLACEINNNNDNGAAVVDIGHSCDRNGFVFLVEKKAVCPTCKQFQDGTWFDSSGKLLEAPKYRTRKLLEDGNGMGVYGCSNGHVFCEGV